MYLTEKYKKPISPSQAKSYEESLKHYRDLKNSLDTAHDEGYEEGLDEGKKEGVEEGKRAIIQILHQSGLSINEISKLTKIS